MLDDDFAVVSAVQQHGSLPEQHGSPEASVEAAALFCIDAAGAEGTTDGQPGQNGHVQDRVDHDQDRDGQDLDRQEQADSETALKSGPLPKLDHFWDSLKAAKRAKRTVEEYQLESRWWAARARSIGEVTYTLSVIQVESFVRDLHPATLRRKTSFLRSLGRFYLRQGHERLYFEMAKLQSAKLPERLPRDLGTKRFIEIREQAKALCAEGDRRGLWLGLMACGGLRVSEIQSVIPAGDGRHVRIIGKGDRERLVPLFDWLMESVLTMKSEGNGGWRKSRKTVWRSLAKMGVSQLHALRHTFASELLRRDKPIEQVRVLLGHSRLDTTAIYLKLRVPDTRVLEAEEEGD